MGSCRLGSSKTLHIANITRQQEKKNMKLVAGAALLAASASSQNIESLVSEFISKIYQVDETGKVHNFNIEPYFVAEYECLGDGFKSAGYYGNGNGKIQYSEEANWSAESVSYELKTSGKVSSAPLALVLPLPEEVSTDSFDETLKFEASMAGVKASMAGTIGSGSYDGKFSLALGALATTAKKFSIDAHEYWSNYLPPHGSTNVQLSASMKKSCVENPLDRQCTAKIAVDGQHNNNALGNTVAKYSVQKKRASVVVTQNGADVVSVSLVGINDMQVLGLKYKLAGKPGVLVFQSVGPAGYQAVVDAAMEFAGPFINFFSKIDFSTADQPAHIIAYFDKVMQAIPGNGCFNAFPVIAASKIESELLAEKMQVSSLQSAAEQYCESANALIEDACSKNHKYVAEARDFVRQVVSKEGEKTFDNWFSTL